jgi:hypothetical protein
MERFGETEKTPAQPSPANIDASQIFNAESNLAVE